MLTALPTHFTHTHTHTHTQTHESVLDTRQRGPPRTAPSSYSGFSLFAVWGDRPPLSREAVREQTAPFPFGGSQGMAREWGQLPSKCRPRGSGLWTWREGAETSVARDNVVGAAERVC